MNSKSVEFVMYNSEIDFIEVCVSLETVPISKLLAAARIMLHSDILPVILKSVVVSHVWIRAKTLTGSTHAAHRSSHIKSLLVHSFHY